MTRLQQTLYQLLKEIHQICVQNKISYVLHPQLVLYFRNGLEMPENQRSRCVYMTPENMQRFVSVCSRNLPKDRSIESLHSNPKYPYLYSARYSDTRTLHLNINEGFNYINNGIFIRIEVLRSRPQSVIKKKFLTLLETGWRLNTYQYITYCSKKDFLAKSVVRSMLLFGRKRLSHWLHDFAVKSYQCENSVVLVRWKNYNLILPKHIFALERMTLVDGNTFYIPAGWEDYLRLALGQDYAYILERKYIAPISIIENPYVSSGSFFQANPQLEVFFRQRMTLRKDKIKINLLLNYQNFCWAMINMTGDKYKLKTHYRNNRSKILYLRKNNNWDELMIIFEPYYRTQEKYIKYKQTFSVDDELDEIYYETLCHNGEKQFAERMRKYL